MSKKKEEAVKPEVVEETPVVEPAKEEVKKEAPIEIGSYSYKKVKDTYEVYDKAGALHRVYPKEMSEKVIKAYVEKRTNIK